MSTCLAIAAAALPGCGTSLCDDSRDPTMTFCQGDRLSLAEAIERARGRQPELADAVLVRATSSSIGAMNVDGKDTSWQLIFVVADGSDRTLTVTPSRTDVRPGGAPMGSCAGAAPEALPASADATQSAVLEFEEGFGTVQQGEAHALTFFYEHECYDAMTPSVTAIEIQTRTDTGNDYRFYKVNEAGAVVSVCGTCDVSDIHACTFCNAP